MALILRNAPASEPILRNAPVTELIQRYAPGTIIPKNLPSGYYITAAEIANNERLQTEINSIWKELTKADPSSNSSEELMERMETLSNQRVRKPTREEVEGRRDDFFSKSYTEEEMSRLAYNEAKRFEKGTTSKSKQRPRAMPQAEWNAIWSNFQVDYKAEEAKDIRDRGFTLSDYKSGRELDQEYLTELYGMQDNPANRWSFKGKDYLFHGTRN